MTIALLFHINSTLPDNTFNFKHESSNELQLTDFLTYGRATHNAISKPHMQKPL